MKNHILRLILVALLFESAAAQAQSPAYPQVPPSAASDVSPYGGPPQQSQYTQALPPANPAPYTPAPYNPAPTGPAPYGPAPYNPTPYSPAPYSPAPSGGPAYTPAPAGPSYSPAPAMPASYDGPPPYTPAPYSPSPYGPPAYTPAPYTPAPGAPLPYTPAPSAPPAYTPAPNEHLPIGPLDGPRWLFSADALFLERSIGSSVYLGGTYYNVGSGQPQAFPTDNLYSDDELFNYEAGVRLQLGRRITDDVAVDAIYWGLQSWNTGRDIYGDPVGETVLATSPWTQTDKIVGAFDNYLGYTYKSQVNNFELNERIMLNEHDPYHSLAWLWGFRYFQLSDNFTLSGSDLYSDTYENINWRTQNELLGLQTGLQWTRGWERFQIVTEGKAGVFANFYSQKGNNLNSSGVSEGNPAGFVPFSVSHDGTDAAALLELSVLARYRLNDFLWLRLGYQGTLVTGLALGPRQLGGYSHGGTVAFDGPSIGMEATW